jgi:REP element-mobilizing transposase RayT
LVVGHHLVWTAYGWWLPNDPRGSSSRQVRVPRVAELGELHQGRKAVQPSTEELREFCRRARPVLAHPVLAFGEEEVAVLAESFRHTIRQRRYTCYACAIMPEHVHLLIRIHRDRAEQMQAQLQDASRDALIAAGRRRGNHPVWGGRGWKGFQFTRRDMERTVRYIEDNPAERGLPPQPWDFVTPYDGWLPAGAKP